MSIEIGHRITDIADSVEQKGQSFYATKLRELSCSVSGILASGSGTATKQDFASAVTDARCAAFEIANLVLFCSEREYISESEEAELVNLLKRESKMLENFRQSLLRTDRPVIERSEAIV